MASVNKRFSLALPLPDVASEYIRVHFIFPLPHYAIELYVLHLLASL